MPTNSPRNSTIDFLGYSKGQDLDVLKSVPVYIANKLQLG